MLQVLSSVKVLSKELIRNKFHTCRSCLKRNISEYNLVKPGVVNHIKRVVPNHICKPEYYSSGQPYKCATEIEVKSKEQIERMKSACELARHILDEVGYCIIPGITTEHIDELVYNMSVMNGAYPSPLNYKGFPKSVCTSVNNVACHGIPDDRLLLNGDIINVDVTVYYNGHHGDCSSTFLVGDVDVEGIKLVNATYEALDAAISICRPGVNFSSLGDIIEDVAGRYNYSVVPVFAGHGIGSYFHGPPDIYHCFNDYEGQMQAGMTFTIEPILSEGEGDVIILEDGWTAVTVDNSRTAQWEHTVLITDEGVQILT